MLTRATLTTQAASRRVAILTRAILTMQAAGRRVVDAGTKAIDMLCGLPKLAAIDETVPLAPGLEDVGFRNGGDEHGILTGVPPGKLASSKSPACPPGVGMVHPRGVHVHVHVHAHVRRSAADRFYGAAGAEPLRPHCQPARVDRRGTRRRGRDHVAHRRAGAVERAS